MSRSESPQDLHHVSRLLIRSSSLTPSGCPSGASATWRTPDRVWEMNHRLSFQTVCALPSPLVAQRSEDVGGRKLRQWWLPSGVRALSVTAGGVEGRGGRGGAFFTGTCERTCSDTWQRRGGWGRASIALSAQIRRQMGRRQEGFTHPSGHLNHLWEPGRSSGRGVSSGRG